MALVLSQVVLSLGIPFALFPLLYFTSRNATMGEFVNSKALTIIGMAIATTLTVLDLALVALVLSGW